MDLQPHLIGERVELRAATPDDFDALYAVARDPLIWAGHPAHDRWQDSVFRAFFEVGIASGGMLILLDRTGGEVVGSSRYDFGRAEAGEVEIGWTFLARSHWGGGFNAEMKELMIDHAFRFAEGVIFVVGEGNPRSRRAVEKIGGTLTERRLVTEMAGDFVPHVVYRIDRP